tara:strand:- start:2498 stop:2842 length:345 start_codon:yes stop_codon:yes gene_type:complete
MKNTIKIFTAIFALTICFQFAKASDSELKLKSELTHNVINASSDAYAIIAKTNKGYGKEYSIGVEVYCSTLGVYGIDKIEVRGRSISFKANYSKSNYYEFYYDGETYYFSFKCS